MLLRSTIAALAVALAATAVPAAAHDEPVGLNGCGATAPPNHGRGLCVFYAQPGTYRLEITSDVRYAWAQVTCEPADTMYVNVWDGDGYYDFTVDRLEQGGVCMMDVAAGSVLANNPGIVGAHAHVYRTGP